VLAAALEQEQMTDLYACVRELDMTPLVEVHSQDELDAVLGLSPELVGINNRNLKSMKIDLSTSLELRPLIPPNVTVVAESGVSSPEDVAAYAKAGWMRFWSAPV
jgi:indole-3-glycerol phosphate synthase